MYDKARSSYPAGCLPRPREGNEPLIEKETARETLDVRTGPAGKIDFTYDGVVDLLGDRERGTFLYRSFEDLDPGTKAEMITYEKVDYLRVPGKRKWLRLKAAPEDAVNNFTDMATSLTYIGDVIERGHPDGDESIRGTPMTRYQARVSLRKAAQLAPPDVRPAYDQMVATYRTPSIPVTIWIAKGDGTMRRLRWDVDFTDSKVPAPGGEKSMTVLAELYDFGAEADIQPPPPEQTTEE